MKEQCLLGYIILGSYIRFSCSIIKWNLKRAKITIPLSIRLTNWPINHKGNSNLNWQQFFPCHNIHVFSTSIYTCIISFFRFHCFFVITKNLLYNSICPFVQPVVYFATYWFCHPCYFLNRGYSIIYLSHYVRCYARFDHVNSHNMRSNFISLVLL